MLAKNYRLKKDNDFKKVFQAGKAVKGDAFMMRFTANNKEVTRFAFIVGLKFSKKAVVRNRARRMFSEAVRKLYEKIKPGYDVAIMPKIIAGIGQDAILADLAETFKKAGIYV